MTFALHFAVCIRTRGCVCVCACVSKALAWMTIWSMGGQVSCQHVRGRGVTVAVSGDLIIWWTQQWRGHIHTSLSRVACLIRPLLMQGSGGTYRKYWSCFDRVFSPLHDQQCITAVTLILCTRDSIIRCHCRGAALISIPKQAACVCV